MYVLTKLATTADVVDGNVEIAPVAVQEDIPSGREIGAKVVGQDVLAIRIDSWAARQSYRRGY